MTPECNCPFCDSDNIHLIQDGTDYSYRCGDCYAQGPASTSKDGALQSWNERA